MTQQEDFSDINHMTNKPVVVEEAANVVESEYFQLLGGKKGVLIKVALKSGSIEFALGTEKNQYSPHIEEYPMKDILGVE